MNFRILMFTPKRRGLMPFRLSIFLAGFLAAIRPGIAAEPVKIGVTSILSGPTADRGQSEQYGIELALQRQNEAGGVLGRPIEAFYGDNAADPATGVAAAKRLIEQQHVSVLLGALATPVTRAIIQVANDAAVPFVIDISAGHEFVDVAGAGGNAYVFKTNPSEIDIAAGMIAWLKKRNVGSVAIVADENEFNRASATAMQTAAAAAGIKSLANEVVAKGTTNLEPLIERFNELKPDRIIAVLSTSTGAFFRAYEQSGVQIPLAGRIDFASAMTAVSPQFVSAGGFENAAAVSAFTPTSDEPGIQDFVQAYRAKYGLVPTQRSFFGYEAARLVVDAIRRANSDKPEDVQRALKSSIMVSLLGGTYAMDGHNHPHTPLQIIGVRNGKVVVLDHAGSS
jgi:branched-chain amino acid transport system substrate-binding protein